MYIESENKMVYCCKEMKDYFEVDECVYFSEVKRKVCLNVLGQNYEKYDHDIQEKNNCVINYCPFCGKKILIEEVKNEIQMG